MGQGNTPQQIGGALMVGGAAFIAYNLLIKPAVDQATKGKEEAQAGTNPVTQQALQLRSALDPTFTLFNATNKGVVRDVATQITDLNGVAASYTNLTAGRTLQTDLEKCLSASEYQAFMNQIAANTSSKPVTNPATGKTTQVVTPFGGGFIIFAKKNLNLRSSPEIKGTTNPVDRALASFNEALSRYNLGTTNIIGIAKAGEFVGYFTGAKPVVDQKSNTKFIEVCYQINGKSPSCPASLRNQHGKLVKFWVSASSNLITTYHFYKDVMKVYNGGTPVVMTWKQKPAAITLSGFPSNKQLGSALFTVKPAMLYDRNLRSTVQIPAGTPLGKRGLSIETPGGIRYHQYTSKDGEIFWINSFATNQPE